MVRILLSFLVFIGMILNSCKQKRVDCGYDMNDSVKKYLELAKDNSLELKIRSKYNDKAYSLTDFKKNDSLTRWYIYRLNANMIMPRDINKLKKLSKILINKSLAANDSIGLFRGYHCLGYSYMVDSKNEEAIKFFLKAKKGYSKKKLFKNELRVMENIATTQYYANDFLGSIKTSYEIINKAKKYKIKDCVSTSYLNIGNNLSYLKNNLKAIEYYKKVRYDKNDLNDICILNNNIVSSYIAINEYKKAYEYLQFNIDNFNEKSNRVKDMGVTYSLLGLYYLKVNKPSRAYFFLKKAETFFESIKVLNGENYNRIYFSEYYARVNDTTKAIYEAKQALRLSKSYKNPNDILLSLTQIINVDKKEALLHSKEYIRVSDSLQVSERLFRDKFAQIRFETFEITQEKEKAIKNTWFIGIISGAIILMIIVINRQHNKQKELVLLQIQQKSNEDIYRLMLKQREKEDEVRQAEKKRIARELHDGIMNRLSSTRLSLSLLNHNATKEIINKCILKINDIKQIESDIRTISHDLSHEVFQEEDTFVKMLHDLVKKNFTENNMNFEIEIDVLIDWNGISSQIKMNLYRILQEAINNINKHSKADKTIVNIVFDKPFLCMSITDNGIGFDISTVSREGIGIQNMKERVELLNGHFSISSQNGNTSINISIPF